MSKSIREPAVAGMFYPANPSELSGMINGFLREVKAHTEHPKAIIVPHAGYIYSGPVAAYAYAQLLPLRDRIRRVVLLGPSHRVSLRGIAASTADYFSTPLGQIPIDHAAIESILECPQVDYHDNAHAMEHSLEVHLPFLQSVLSSFALVPLVVGETAPRHVAEVLQALWGGDETLVVISTDLSHYHSYKEAKGLDSATSQAIEHLEFSRIGGEDACGCYPLNGLLYLARAEHLNITTLDLRSSGDTAGPREEVVGYGAYVVTEPHDGGSKGQRQSQ